MRSGSCPEARASAAHTSRSRLEPGKMITAALTSATPVLCPPRQILSSANRSSCAHRVPVSKIGKGAPVDFGPPLAKAGEGIVDRFPVRVGQGQVPTLDAIREIIGPAQTPSESNQLRDRRLGLAGDLALDHAGYQDAVRISNSRPARVAQSRRLRRAPSIWRRRYRAECISYRNRGPGSAAPAGCARARGG